MKYPRLYPDYRGVVPPCKKRWGVAWLVGNLLFTFFILWLWPLDKVTHTAEFWFWTAVFPTLFIGFLFAARVLIYQVASGNQRAYRHILQQEEVRWWRQRAAGLPIEPWCLLGPGGDKPEHHLAALARDSSPPEYLITQHGSRVLRCPQILENDIWRREAALTRHLVRTLIETFALKSSCPPVFQALYWCGSSQAGQQFMQTLCDSGWQFQQPLLPLNDIDQLDDAIDHYHRLSRHKNRLLCAGIYSASHIDSTQITGEAGFVWCVGVEKKVIVQRAERQDTPDETALMLTRQVEKIALMTSPPEHCLSFNNRAAEYLQSGGWPTLEHILAPYWGALQQMSPFVAISMAAFRSLEAGQSCGWIAQDQMRKCIIGVITIDK